MRRVRLIRPLERTAFVERQLLDGDIDVMQDGSGSCATAGLGQQQPVASVGFAVRLKGRFNINMSDGQSLTLRDDIESVFGVAAFAHPTFYSHPGGLRFELSEGGSAVEQFLTAHRKAALICGDIFGPSQPITVCLSIYLRKSIYGYRDALRDLARAGVKVPRTRSMWLVNEEDPDDDDAAKVLYIAFVVDRSLLDGLLWCALGVDLGIRPCPRLWSVYLINLPNQVLVHPYDLAPENRIPC